MNLYTIHQSDTILLYYYQLHLMNFILLRRYLSM